MTWGRGGEKWYTSRVKIEKIRLEKLEIVAGKMVKHIIKEA